MNRAGWYRRHRAAGRQYATATMTRTVSYRRRQRMRRARREYDEPGRLVSETSRSGETVRYRYDDAHSELPATTTDATGSTRQMTWSRYGQLLAFTDCSGYQTRYEYDRFGQMTAVHREEGISLYRHYDNRGRLTSVKDAQGRETQYEYNAAGDLTAVITPVKRSMSTTPQAT